MKGKLPQGAAEVTLYMLSNKWKFLIIRELLSGTKRFGEIKNGLGSITQKVLTQNLRELEENGLVKRVVYAQVPPKVEYSLTKTGTTLEGVINAMTNWGEYYKSKKHKTEAPEELAVPVLEVESYEPEPEEKPAKRRNDMASFLL